MDGRKRALVVGIDAYGGGIPRLASAVRDAEAVAEQLEHAHQYEVELLRDGEATAGAIMASLARVATAGLTPDDSFVLYFAGHGTNDHSDEPQGFLLGADAKRTKDEAWLAMSALKNALVDGLSCRHLMVVLDCCNAGAFRFAQTRAVGGVKRPLYRSQYERYRNGIAWHVLTAAAHDETADDAAPFTDDRGESERPGGHSPFAQALIAGLLGAADTSRRDVAPDGVLTATELHQYIYDMVAVNDRQTPGIYPLKPDNKGEFVFHLPGVTPELEDDPPFDPNNNPWFGSRPYTAADGDLFFGRGEATARLRERVDSRRFVAVVGASGCGKSSLLRAGLLPALEPSDWIIAESTPLTADPTAQLDEARVLLAAAPVGGRQLLLIDQFEDIFRLADDAAQSRFLGELRALVEAEAGPTVVIAVRSDFEPRAASALGDLWTADARFAVPEFTEDDLEDVILGPALATAVFFEPDRIVDDLERAVAQAPGAAPLLSLTLASLYRHAYDRHVANDPSDRTISQEDYDVDGGVVGVVHQLANELYESADPDGRETIRRILLRLVDQTAEGLTPRTVERSEFRFGSEHDQRFSSVLDDLVAARLLTVFSKDGIEYVKPAHAALVSTWDKQLEWLAASGSQDVVRRASEAARLWSEQNGKSTRSKHLWNQNPRLDNLVVRSEKGELNELEREFTSTSLRRRKRLARIRRVAIVSLMILTAVAVAAGIFAWVKRSEAIQEAERASSRALAADALINVEIETDLAALLALEGVRVANTTDARGSLAGVLSVPTRFVQRSDVSELEITAIAFSESGQTAVTADADGVVTLWDVKTEPFESPLATTLGVVETGLSQFETGATIRDLFVTDSAEFPVLAFDTEGFALLLDFEGDADVLEPPVEQAAFVDATVNVDLTVFAGITADGVLRVYEFEGDLSFTPGPTVDVNPDGVTDLAVSPDGTTLAWGDGSDLAVWSLNDRSQPQMVPLGDNVVAIAFGPDDAGTAVVGVGLEQGTVVVVDRNDPSLRSEVFPAPVNQLFDLAFKLDSTADDPDDDDDGPTFTLASTHSNGDVNLFEVLPGDGFEPVGFAVETMLGHNDEAKKVAFSPDGRIASGTFSGELIWWLDVPASSLGVPFMTPDGPTAQMADAAFVTPTQTVSFDADGTVWLWDLDSGSGLTIAEKARVTSIDAAVGAIAVGLEDGSAAIVDPDGTLVHSLAAAHPLPVALVALSNDGSRLATVSPWDEAGFVGHVAIWDVATGTLTTEQDLPDGFEPMSALFDDSGVLWIGGRDLDSLPTVLEIDATTGDVLGALLHSSRPGNGVTALALSDDGGTLAAGAMDRRISLWTTDSLEARSGGEFTGHRGNVTGIVFWDGGETLISSDDAGDVLMWDVSERRLFGTLGGPTDDVRSLEVDPDSQTLLASSEEGAVWTWTLDPDEWRFRACELAGRNMTAAEWELFGDGGTRVRHCPDMPAGDGDVRDADYGDALTD